MTTTSADRHCYAWGYKTRDAAENAVEDMFASAEISECENPTIKSYTNKAGARRFAVWLDR